MQQSSEKVYRLTRQQLYELVWSRSLSGLASEFGISGNGLAKICDRMLVPHPPRGYWSGRNRSRNEPRPPLPPRPEDCDADVVISSRRAPSRRGRTRLSLTARRDQIADAAADLVVREGVKAVTMKRIAREVGISEALAYNYFPSQTELLDFLARREQAEMSASQQAEIDKQTQYKDRMGASQQAYLDYVARRGGLLQTLLSSAEVRKALRLEYQSRRAWSSQATSEAMTEQLGVPTKLAQPGSQVLRAVGIRAGMLLAAGKCSREAAGRLSLAIMTGSREALIAMAQAQPLEAPPTRRRPSPGKATARGRRRGA